LAAFFIGLQAHGDIRFFLGKPGAFQGDGDALVLAFQRLDFLFQSGILGLKLFQPIHQLFQQGLVGRSGRGGESRQDHPCCHQGSSQSCQFHD